jgi:hypothetical protein
MRVDAEITNNASGTAMAIKVNFLDQNFMMIKQKLIDYLEPDMAKNASIASLNVSELTRIYVVIDPYNKIAETNEANNEDMTIVHPIRLYYMILAYAAGGSSSENYSIEWVLTSQPVGVFSSENYTVYLGWPYYFEER